MDQNIKSGITFGVAGGLLIFLFGGWSVAVIGALLGVWLGSVLGSRLKPKAPRQMAREALPSALAAAGVLLVLSLLQNYVVGPSIGKSPFDLNTVLGANLSGVLVVIALTCSIAATYGLSPKRAANARLIIIGLVILIFPFFDQFSQLRWTAQIIFALIFVVLGLGLNIVVGYAGLLDLGYAAFFAIGAYTTGILSSPQHNIFLNFWLVIWIAALVGAIFGIILGSPTLPLRGDYLAIVTLGFGEIVPVLFRNLIDVTIKEPLTCWILPMIKVPAKCYVLMSHVDLTAGEKGINPIGRPFLPLIGEFKSSDPASWYFLIIAIILLLVFINNRLRDSRIGRAWMAIREDELAAAQMGINPVRTKLLAFAMGATFSGFAGAFYASYISGIFPGVFDFSASIIILCCVILGGLGNYRGVIIGGLVLMTADRLFLPALKDFLAGLLQHTLLPALSFNTTLQSIVAQNANPVLYRFLLFGLTLVVMMAVRPEGLLPSEQIREEMHADENEPAPAGAVAPVAESGSPK